jgi:excisionase family DNA binding protein
VQPPKDLCTLTESAEITRLTPFALRDMIVDGRITGYQPGGPRGKYLIPRSELERIMRPVEAKK